MSNTGSHIYRKSSYRNLILDLGNQHARPALEVLLNMEHRRGKVRSALISSENGKIHTGSANSSRAKIGAEVAEIFALLSRLPNLKHLTVDLCHFLPVQALCFLSNAPRLRQLELHNIHFTGVAEGQDTSSIAQVTHQVLSCSSSLQELAMKDCKGVPALQLLFASGLLARVQKLTLKNTPLGMGPEFIDTTLRALFKPDLQSLKLYDIPNLNDLHIATLAAALHSSKLQELEFTSSIFGASIGQILIQSLHHNSSPLQNLMLHIDWEDCGDAVAAMLRTNRGLKQLDLRLYGDDDRVQDDAIIIARALQNNPNTSLKGLRLVMELEPTEGIPTVAKAFEETLQVNHTLRHLELDDGLEDFTLPRSLEAKLRLNRSGAPQLWKRKNPASPDQFVQALICQRDDLDTLFYILREEPTLCSLALHNESREECHGSSDDHHPVSPVKSHSFPLPTVAQTKRFFHRRVMKTIFAKSA